MLGDDVRWGSAERDKTLGHQPEDERKLDLPVPEAVPPLHQAPRRAMRHAHKPTQHRLEGWIQNVEVLPVLGPEVWGLLDDVQH